MARSKDKGKKEIKKPKTSNKKKSKKQKLPKKG